MWLRTRDLPSSSQCLESTISYISHLSMSEPSKIAPAGHRFSLVLHTAVDFGKTQGIGIGLIQQAATGADGSDIFPKVEQKHGIERGQVGVKNVKTPERAHMFALILAMGLARNTLKRACNVIRAKVLTVTFSATCHLWLG